jgi:hypothetical protein
MAAEEKKKPGLALVIGMGKGKATDEAEEAPSSSKEVESGETDVALEEMFEAIKSGDLEAFKDAAKAFKSC